MHSVQLQSLCVALGLASQAYGHAFSSSVFMERDSAMFGPFSRRNLEPGMTKRQAATGAACGATKGGVSCGAGLCCSADGFCGTGGAFCTAPACQLQYGPGCDANKSPSGTDTSKDPRPAIGLVPVGVTITKCTIPGKIALTFDDGPYIYTPALLDLLAKNNVKATFFVVGVNGGKGEIEDESTGYPAVIQRMVKEGHQVASHTWSHADLTTLTSAQRRDQLIKNEVALTKILGFFPTYMRPPYANVNADVLADAGALGYHVVNFDTDTNDWQGDYVAAKNNFIGPVSKGTPGSSSFLVLMHDIHQDTVNVLVPYVLDQIKALGYSTATVGECLGDPASNWYRNPTSGTAVADAGADIAKAESSASKNSTIVPTATVSEAAFGAQSTGKSNGTTNGTITQGALPPSSPSPSARTGDAVVVSAMGVVSLLSVVAFFMSFL